MNFQQTLYTIVHAPRRKSIILKGDHGLGKSQCVAQAAAAKSKALGLPVGFVDIRLGQYEVGDLIGLQRVRDTFSVVQTIYENGEEHSKEVIAENVCAHDLPLWFPRDPQSHGYLFLDELNRGSRDTQQWAMQIVLDYKSNFVELPENWHVIAACNDNVNEYTVQLLDPALDSRFLTIKFKPTVPEAIKHFEEVGVHDAILKYLSKFPSDLDLPDQRKAGEVQQNRRAWEMLSDWMNDLTKQGEDPLNTIDYLLLLASGYIGSTVAVNFTEFILKDYKVFSVTDILNNFTKVKKDFEKMVVTDFTFYTKELVNHLSKNKPVLTQKQSANLFEFAKVMPKEACAGLWASMLKECRDTATKWYKGSPEIGAYIQELLTKTA